MEENKMSFASQWIYISRQGADCWVYTDPWYTKTRRKRESEERNLALGTVRGQQTKTTPPR
jgi:hypothetical protein